MHGLCVMANVIILSQTHIAIADALIHPPMSIAAMYKICPICPCPYIYVNRPLANFPFPSHSAGTCVQFARAHALSHTAATSYRSRHRLLRAAAAQQRGGRHPGGGRASAAQGNTLCGKLRPCRADAHVVVAPAAAAARWFMVGWPASTRTHAQRTQTLNPAYTVEGD